MMYLKPALNYYYLSLTAILLKDFEFAKYLLIRYEYMQRQK